MILDSSFIIDLLQGRDEAVTLAKSVEEMPLSTTCIIVFEIFQGARDDEIPKLKEFFSQLTVLDLTHEAAERAGLMQKQLRRHGNSIDPEDCMIAAIALQHRKKLVTRNTKHFSRIPELQLVGY
jgi:tRNA(fMet)-specific endonuclease VapC